MENATISKKGDNLVIEINLKSKGTLSTSGKSMVVASSSKGFGDEIVIGKETYKMILNFYKPLNEAKKREVITL